MGSSTARCCSGDPDQPRDQTRNALVLPRIPGWEPTLPVHISLILSPKVYTWTWLNDCCMVES